MYSNIVYKVDEHGKRISDNWTGEFHQDNTEDSLWIYIKGNSVDIKKGDLIYYSHSDLPNNSLYRVVQAELGIYQVEKIKKE